MTELAFSEDDAPFSRLGFPNAGIEAAIGTLKQVGSCLDGIARKNTVSLRAVAPRLRDRISQSNSASAEESASAAEGLDAQAQTLKDQVAKLRQLVGGNSATVSPRAVPAPRLLPKMPPAITRRRGIPMPGDSAAMAEADDDNFRNF